MKILAVSLLRPNDPPNACQIYRINMPLVFMANRGKHGLLSTTYEDLVTTAQRDVSELLELIMANDVFVFPRAYAVNDGALDAFRSIFKLIRMADKNKRIIYEVDDDYTNKHRDFSSWNMHHAMTIAGWCDAITVTTPYLAKLMQAETKRPTYILPNCLDPAAWMRPQNARPHEGITIGLSGSTTHYKDWEVLKTVLPRILSNDYGFPVRLLLTGFHPDYFRELPATDYITALPYQQYVEMVRACDIVLAPVDPEDAFNYSKSPLKALEGMGATRYLSENTPAGAAVIATNTVTYNSAIKAGKTGLLVQHTPEMWYNAIDSLLRNESLRHKLQLSAHAWVWKHNDISKRWIDWQAAYRQILAKPAHTFISE